MAGGGGDSGGVGLNWPVWAELLLALLIVLLSAFFAGCTLGLLALDKVGLQIIASAGKTEKERRNASKCSLLWAASGSLRQRLDCAFVVSRDLPAVLHLLTFSRTAVAACRKDYTSARQGQLASMYLAYRQYFVQL